MYTTCKNTENSFYRVICAFVFHKKFFKSFKASIFLILCFFQNYCFFCCVAVALNKVDPRRRTY